ncbi:hypothetical protein FRX31_034411 [Thalictrum thalictroides]|uniref:Uncharacterized protein n=1 Tax=Thalictrum thalictroides TaxID=46969 RepID=A0A7J6UTR7_THATH|nr:hypothetical protein FRX31_034411 [Thalictrum thalictroides]
MQNQNLKIPSKIRMIFTCFPNAHLEIPRLDCLKMQCAQNQSDQPESQTTIIQVNEASQATLEWKGGHSQEWAAKVWNYCLMQLYGQFGRREMQRSLE